MKRIKVAIFTALLAAVMGMTAFGDITNNTGTNPVQPASKSTSTPASVLMPASAAMNQQPQRYVGYVREIKDDKDGNKLFLVEAKNGAELYKEIQFVVKPTDATDVEIGDLLEIEYGKAMVETLPPQTVALSVRQIRFKQANPATTFKYGGIVTGIHRADSFGNRLLVVSSLDKNSRFKRIAFVVTSSTQGVKMDTLKIGSHVEVTYGPIMTFSLPPQTKALIITLN